MVCSHLTITRIGLDIKSAACKVRERRPANVALTFMPINPTWPEADISISPRSVRYTPESGH
jgi:hypothetical protein